MIALGLRWQGHGRALALVVLGFGLVFGLTACKGGSESGAGQQKEGGSSSSEAVSQEGRPGHAISDEERYVPFEIREEPVSPEQLCEILDGLALPEAVKQLLMEGGKVLRSDYCARIYSGPKAKQLPMPDIIEETFQSIRKHHPDLLVYARTELTEQIEVAQAITLRFIRLPNLLVEIVFLPQGLSSAVNARVKVLHDLNANKIWKYDYVAGVLNPIAQEIASQLKLQQLILRSYENGAITYMYSVPPGQQSDQLVDQLRDYLRRTGWQNIDYASIMGVTALEAEKEGVKLTLGNVRDLRQQSNAMFTFVLQVKE